MSRTIKTKCITNTENDVGHEQCISWNLSRTSKGHESLTMNTRAVNVQEDRARQLGIKDWRLRYTSSIETHIIIYWNRHYYLFRYSSSSMEIHMIYLDIIYWDHLLRYTSSLFRYTSCVAIQIFGIHIIYWHTHHHYLDTHHLWRYTM